jgi:hypothetical protein
VKRQGGDLDTCHVFSLICRISKDRKVEGDYLGGGRCNGEWEGVTIEGSGR